MTGLGAMRLLEAVRASRIDTRVYQASTSEIFGSTPPPQSEQTPFHPRSPYGVAKLYAFWATVNYREAYDMFAVNGILFNHESPRRGETFVTRKITRAVARIKAGLQDKLYLGNLESIRDWGYAPEYVEGMWRMLQVDEPDDVVLATGVGATVEQFAEASFRVAGLDHSEWVAVDPSYYRPAEVELPARRTGEGRRRARVEGDDALGRARPDHGRGGRPARRGPAVRAAGPRRPLIAGAALRASTRSAARSVQPPRAPGRGRRAIHPAASASPAPVVSTTFGTASASRSSPSKEHPAMPRFRIHVAPGSGPPNTASSSSFANTTSGSSDSTSARKRSAPASRMALQDERSMLIRAPLTRARSIARTAARTTGSARSA